MKKPDLSDLFLKSWRPFAWLFVLIAALYSHTLFYGFSPLDDTWLLVERLDYIKDPGNIKSFFTSALLGEERGYYRPIWAMSFMIDSMIGDGSPLVYHLTNILLHIITTFVVFILIRSLTSSIEWAFLLSLLFSVHPLFAFNVGWIPGRNDTLLALFAFIALYGLTGYIKKRKILYFVLQTLFLVLALLTKETAIVIPLLFVVYIVLFKPAKKIDNIWLSLSWIIAVVSWFVIRSLMVNDMSNISESLDISALIRIAKMNIIAFGKVVIPVLMSSKMSFYVGLIVILLLTGLGIRNKTYRSKEFIFGTVWFVAFISVPSVFKNNFNEWWLYPSLIGVLIVLYKLFYNIEIRKILIPFLAIVIASGIYTVYQTRHFKNEITFADYFAGANPTLATAHFFKGVAYAKHDMPGEAVAALTRVIELDENFNNAYYNRGLNYFRLKEYQKAVNDLNVVINAAPQFPKAYFLRGVSLFWLSRFEESYNDLIIAVNRDPYNEIIYYYLAISALEIGLIEEGWQYLLKSEELGYQVSAKIKNRFLDKRLKNTGS